MPKQEEKSEGKLNTTFVEDIRKQLRKWLAIAPTLTTEAIEGPLQDVDYRIDKV